MIDDENVVPGSLMDVTNRTISEDLIMLTNTIGNLLIHVSGEGKVDFRQKEGPGWLSMIKYIISGDIGCMRPYKGYDTCAFEQAIEWLLNLESVPHLNSSVFEEYVVEPEKWREFVLGIKEDLSFVGAFKKQYIYELKGGPLGDDVIAVIKLEPLVNAFVTGEFQATRKMEFMGQMEDYDEELKFITPTINGKDLKIDRERLVIFRGPKFRPRKGDYLLFDEEGNYYVILPQEDYSIH
jgi:hypothetical protein